MYFHLQFLEVPIPDVPFPSGNEKEQVNAFLEGKVREVSFGDASPPLLRWPETSPAEGG